MSTPSSMPETMTFSFGDQSMYTANQSSNNTVIGLDPLRLVETSHIVRAR